MFERYTEYARRVLFFARYETSQFGSNEIEPEHLLLGLLREDRPLMDRFVPGASEVRKQIEREKPPGPKVSTSKDLPLSHSAKRVFAFGAEEAERMNHSHIGTEHLLLGLLREKCLASRILETHGVKLEVVREQIAKSAAAERRPLTPEEAATERDALHSLIAALPDDALRRMRQMIERSRYRTSPRSEMLDRMRQRMLERTGHAGPSFFKGGEGWLQEGQFSSSSMENGTMIFETRRVHKGHQIRMIERIRFSDDGKTLHYAQELHGPKGEHSWSQDFDLT
jgi:ATP-dependent Clp protease ATP-binding subunit ClpA